MIVLTASSATKSVNRDDQLDAQLASEPTATGLGQLVHQGGGGMTDLDASPSQVRGRWVGSPADENE